MRSIQADLSHFGLLKRLVFELFSSSPTVFLGLYLKIRILPFSEELSSIMTESLQRGSSGEEYPSRGKRI